MEEMKTTEGQGQAQTDSFGARVREALGLAADAPEEKVLRTCRLYAEEHACVMALVASVMGDGKRAVRVGDAVNPYEEC